MPLAVSWAPIEPSELKVAKSSAGVPQQKVLVLWLNLLHGGLFRHETIYEDRIWRLLML